MTLRLACSFLLGVILLAGASAQAGEVVDLLNRLRAPGGACAAKAQPFAANALLDKAAGNLAGGAGLDEALQAAGYRMTRVQMLTLDGGGAPLRLEEVLPRAYCAQIATPQLIDAGVFQSGNRLWIVLAAPFAPNAGLTRQQIADATLVLVNEARARPRRCGDRAFAAARPVRWNTVLESTARSHAADMAAHNYFSHSGRDGSQPQDRATRAGYAYRAIGENIAAGQVSPGDAVASWLGSPPHCANLMDPVFEEMGAAVVTDMASAQGAYWVQLFGKQQR